MCASAGRLSGEQTSVQQPVVDLAQVTTLGTHPGAPEFERGSGHPSQQTPLLLVWQTTRLPPWWAAGQSSVTAATLQNRPN